MKKILIGCMLTLLLALMLILTSCSRVQTADTTANTTDGAISVNGTLDESDTTSADTTALPAKTTAVTTTESPFVPEPKPYTTVAIASGEMYTGSLIGVDKEHPYCYRVTSMYTPQELDKLSEGELSELGWVSLYHNKDGNYLLRSRLIYLRSDAYRAFTAMMSDYVAKSGNRDVQVRFGYQLINSSPDVTSLSDERATGLVVEINVFTDEGTFSIDHASKKSAYFMWFSEHCHKYGFIMTAESGMLRYVGIPHATYVREKGLTLSEYLLLVSQHTFDEPLTFTDATGVLWRVYGVAVENGSLTAIPVKDGSVYLISGDNQRGFIVASRDA